MFDPQTPLLAEARAIRTLEPVEVVDLPTLQRELDTLETLMIELQEERKKSWLPEKRRRSITERFHSVKKKRELLWAKIEKLKRR